jgi:tetratricopeptide (TPR) repeat protein
LGDALLNLNRNDEAISVYRKFLQLEANCYGCEKLASLLVKQAHSTQPPDRNGLESAYQLYLQAIELNPSYLQPYYQALELKPNNAAIYFRLAKAYEREGDWAIAITFYHLGLQIEPHHPEIYFDLGVMLEQRERTESAIACYQTAVSLNPEELKYSKYLTSVKAKVERSQSVMQ